MALGGRELRLILSIQSYGTSNFAKVRRDITALERATKGVNLSQLGVQKQILGNAEKVRGITKQIETLERSRIGAAERLNANQLRRVQITKQLTNMGYRDFQIQSILRGEWAARSVQAQKLFSQLGLINASSKKILSTQAATTAEIRIQNVSLAEQEAIGRRLLTDDLARARANERMLRFQTRVRTAAHVGRTAQFGGLIGIAGFAAAANTAAKFNKELALAATQTRNIDAPLSQVITRTQQLEHGFDQDGKHLDGILGLMKQFPAPATDMAKAAYDIYSSMQITFPQGLKLLKSFNQLAVATGSDLPTATNAAITTLNNFGNSTKDLDKNLNLMVSTIRFGRMRLEDLNGMLNKVAPAASSTGQAFEDVAGAMALITTRQPSQAMSATGIARLLQTFSDPDFQKGTFRFGVDITKGAGAVGKLKPLPVIIDQMAKSFGLFQKFGGPAQLFKELTSTGLGRGAGRQSRIEAQRAYTFLVKNLKDYHTLQQLVTGDTVEFNRALKAMSAAPGVRWAVFQNQMRAFIITIGEAALPALLKLAGYLIDAAHWFENLSKHTRHLIVRIGVFTAAALLLGGTLTAILAPLLGFIGTLWLMSRALGIAGGTGVLGRLGRMVGLLQIAAGIGVIVIGVKLVKQGGGWGFLGRLLEGIGVRSVVSKVAGKTAGKIAGPLAPAIEALVNPETAGGAGATFGKTEEIIAKLPKQFRGQAEDIFHTVLESKGGTLAQARKAVADFLQSVGIKTDDVTKKHMTRAQKLMADYNKLVKQANIATIKGLKDQSQQLQSAYAAQTEKLDKNKGAVEKAARAHDALTKAKLRLTQANLRLQTAEEAAMKQVQTVFGQIGQGPIMGGPLGQIFSNINQTLAGFGAKPIPIPAQLVLGDQAAQQRNFDLLDRDLTFFQKRLTKAKLPKVFIQAQVQSLVDQGAAALPFLEGVRHMNPAQLRRYIAQLRKEERTLRKATESPWQKQLTAADMQLKAARINLDIAKNNLVAAQRRVAGLAGHTIHYHGDTIHVRTDETNAQAIQRFLKQRDFQRRNKSRTGHK